MKDIAGELTAFLIKINSGITQGLPTGPFVTSILADILMTDVDEFIKNKNFEVIRYMDDIRVYSDNKEELQSFKEELQSYLEKEHKLCLSPTKTRIFKNSEFHESENLKLLNEEIIQKLIDKVIEKSDVYKKFEKVTIDDLTIKDRISVLNQKEDEFLLKVFDEILKTGRKFLWDYCNCMFGKKLKEDSLDYYGFFGTKPDMNETHYHLYSDEECIYACLYKNAYHNVKVDKKKIELYSEIINHCGRKGLWIYYNRRFGNKLKNDFPDYYGFFGEYYSSEG